MRPIDFGRRYVRLKGPVKLRIDVRSMYCYGNPPRSHRCNWTICTNGRNTGIKYSRCFFGFDWSSDRDDKNCRGGVAFATCARRNHFRCGTCCKWSDFSIINTKPIRLP